MILNDVQTFMVVVGSAVGTLGGLYTLYEKLRSKTRLQVRAYYVNQVDLSKPAPEQRPFGVNIDVVNRSGHSVDITGVAFRRKEDKRNLLSMSSEWLTRYNVQDLQPNKSTRLLIPMTEVYQMKLQNSQVRFSIHLATGEKVLTNWVSSTG